jgi:hypothetical protein
MNQKPASLNFIAHMAAHAVEVLEHAAPDDAAELVKRHRDLLLRLQAVATKLLDG